MSDATIKIEGQGMFRKDWVSLDPNKPINDEWTFEIQGFKTEKDFTRYLCRQICGMMQDLAKGDGDTLFKRIESLYGGADMYLTLEGDGVSNDHILGIINHGTKP